MPQAPLSTTDIAVDAQGNAFHRVGNQMLPLGGDGGVNYSTSEQDSGQKWIDGRTIYQKTWILSSSTSVAFNVPDIDFVVAASITTTINRTSGNTSFPSNQTFGLWFNGNEIWADNPPAYGTLWYVKVQT